MKTNSYFLLIAFGFTYFACKKEVVTPPVIIEPEVPVVKKEYVIDTTALVWGDEFDSYTGLPNSTKWGYDLGGDGWGNNELQNYTQSLKNARVENGMLIIEAIKENSGSRVFSSARVVSKNKGDFTYGRFEIKAKLPKGVGTWPALWMLATEQSYGTSYWPDNGEIDIMEHVGFDENRVHGNIHTKAFNHGIGTNKGGSMLVSEATSEFHTYAVNWLPDKIEFQIDGKKYFEFTKESSYSWEQWPFNRKFYLIMNIAVGGNWGGQKGIDDTVFPQKMEVDYVRVYGIKEKK